MNRQMRWPMVARLAGVLALVGAMTIGCSPSRGEGDFSDQRIPDAVPFDAPEETDVMLGGGAGAGTMAGTWVLIHERSSCVETFQTQEQLTRAIYRVDIEQEAERLDESRELCDTSLTPVLDQSITIPDDVLPTIKYVDADFGFISSLRPGGSYTSSTEVALWGLDPEKLDDPVTSPLPEKGGSGSAEVDADEDGNPGVTFELLDGRCLRFTGQRQVIRYRGTFTSPNQIDGVSTGHTDVVVYGSSEPICGIAPTIRANDPDSRFRMYRVDGKGGAVDADENGDDEISCEEVRALPIDRAFESRQPNHDNCEGK